MTAPLTARARAVLGRLPVHLDVERGGKQIAHVVESLGAPFDPMASQLARVRNARRLDHAATLRDLALLGALHGVTEADLGVVYLRAEQLAAHVESLRAALGVGGAPMRAAALRLLDALDVAGGEERLEALAPAQPASDAPDESDAAAALIAALAPLVGFDAILEATRRRLHDICDLHAAGNGTVRAMLLTTLSVLDVEIDRSRNAAVRDALIHEGRTSDLDLNIHDELFHSADHFWHSTYVVPSAPLEVAIGVSIPAARVLMGERIAIAALAQRSTVATAALLQRSAELGVVDPVPATRVSFDVADAIGALEGFDVQRVPRGSITVTGPVARRDFAVRLGVTDERLGTALQSLMGFASVAETQLTPQQLAAAARKWGYAIVLRPAHHGEVVGLEENPLRRERHPDVECAHGALFTVRRRGFGRQTLRVQVHGIEDLTVGPMLVNRDEGRGVVFLGPVPAGSQLLVTEEGRVFLDGADNTGMASSWSGACFADAGAPSARDFVLDGRGTPAARRARFARFVPTGSLDREGVVPHVAEALVMPGINVGETRFAFFVQQAHLAARGVPPAGDLTPTPRTVIGFADQSTFAGSSSPQSPAPEDPPAARLSLSWLEHEGYAVRVLIPSRFRQLDDESPGLPARVRAALERVRPSGVAVRVEYLDDRWTLGDGTVTDVASRLNDNPNDLLQGGTTLWSPDDL
ncbi:MAG: hypothetical protein IT360_23540 [Gemmatimonadaceae bacterium]|nr:hypothetical protein [Gemmatimonadaceae bacterium]